MKNPHTIRGQEEDKEEDKDKEEEAEKEKEKQQEVLYPQMENNPTSDDTWIKSILLP